VHGSPLRSRRRFVGAYHRIALLAALLAPALLPLSTLFAVGMLVEDQPVGGDAPKVAPPDLTSKAAAEKKQQIHEIFRAEYAKKSTEDRIHLARHLKEEAARNSDDPLANFMLLCESRDQAILGKSIPDAIAAIDEMGKHYAIDAWEQEFTVLKGISPAALPADAAHAFVEQALTIGRNAALAGNYDLALRAASLGETAARATHQTALAPVVRAVMTQYSAAQAEASKAKEASARLEKNADDPDDNLTVGRFLCLVRNDWDRGLPFLAKGSDPAVKALAVKDAQKPSVPMQCKQLADAWWDLGEQHKPLAVGFHRRAAYWYSLAESSFNGLERLSMKRRIAEVRQQAIDNGEPVESKWISEKATYVAGSQPYADHPPLPSLLDGTAQGDSYSFHTDDKNPWIVIDLKDLAHVTRLEIVNRRDTDGRFISRAKTLTIWTSSKQDGPWTPIWQAKDAQPEWKIDLPSPVTCQFLKLGLRESTGFHLLSVKIFGSID
jgi:hypothetical protein